MKDLLGRCFFAQATIAIVAVGLGFAVLIVWASQIEVSTKASLLANISVTPTSKKNTPPTATFTVSPPVRGSASLTPTQAASKTILASATVTPTRLIAGSSPTSAMPVVSGTPLSTPTASVSAAAPLQLTQPQYAGISANAGLAGENRAAALAPSVVSPHGSYSSLTDQCASCHRVHTSQNRNLVSYAPAQSNLCFACHNGTGATSNIKSQYSDPSVPANNATTSSFYSHPATAATSHTNATNDEFKGVLNRHSECSDCHNPHTGDAALSASSAAGYTVSGALKNITGVDTNNTWKAASVYEYELCYKCHSNYTLLLSYTKSSYKMLDQAAEFNPGNASFHPIESAGKNKSAAMAASLAGTSPYKLWNFTVNDTVRCENCHGDYRLATPASPPAANARNASHTSKFANILMNNYRDRVLKSANESYSAADSALCLQCHAEAPFAPGGGASTATNFPLHSRHMTNIGGQSTSTDIDTPGAGPGKAICAECHYRVHGQGANASGNPSGSRLVNFAPNVTASVGQLKWDPTTRTCYLTCHGDNHSPERY